MQASKVRKGISILLLCLVWYMISEMFGSFFVPKPTAVMTRMISHLNDVSFYHAVMMTLSRAVIGFSISYVSALVLALLFDEWKWGKDFFAPVVTLLKSVPNISFILLILIWFSREVSVMIIVFFILFPSFYSNFMTGLEQMDKTLKEVMIVYEQPLWYQIIKVKIPLLYSYLLASFSSGIGLAFKVGVMAEILGQVNDGIGKKLQWSYLNIDMVGVFAWTLWLIILLLILEKGIVYFVRFMNRQNDITGK